ncbi:thiol reductase thioredoxin [Natrinema sp. CBA1119]|jgi:thioredoxin-like negative regulator of GroEL|uniref:thioredoxin family protein n=1 Tax=Natrinema sp. CBA1119 TaxID=1608465 RepID=UPI000BF71577|nr:thioredoxin family protein [Natrinema sp. CBA1119]PGF14105.1 thiol reductase thioredoxin [Natrinema sp. CBA1119]
MTEPTPSEPTDDGRATQKPVQLHDMADYDDLLAAHDLVLLEFVTSGCGICASMEPVLSGVARSAPGVVATVNAGLVPDLAAEFGVQSVPTLVVLRDGEEVARLDDGFQSSETLVDVLETHAAN